MIDGICSSKLLMVTFSTYFKYSKLQAEYNEYVFDSHFIALAISQKECSVLDKVIKAYF